MGTIIAIAVALLIGYGVGRTHGRQAESADYDKAANKVFGHRKDQ
jgi:hypothetical protein